MKQIGIVIFTVFFAACREATGPMNAQAEKSGIYAINDIDYQPEMVGPNIISGPSFEGHASITPDGKEIYFAVYTNDHSYSTIAHSIMEGNKWSEPQIADFSGKYSDGSPALSPNGKRLYFSSRRPINGKTINSSNDIWYVERNSDNEWGDPQRLTSGINTEFNEFSPSVDENGNLFFCSDRPGGYGDMDVYLSIFKDKVFQAPLLLDDSINSVYHEGNVGVSPNGRLLFVMVQNKPGDFGWDDIHYSLKKGDRWTQAKNIGPAVNTKTFDFSPKVSPDGKSLYFSSRISRDFNAADLPYTYQSFQYLLNTPLNGFGNIYRIELSELKLGLNR